MTARDRIVIVIVLIAAAIVGSWLLVIQPKRDLAAQLGDQVSSLQNQLSAAQANLARAHAAQGSFQSESAQLAGLGEAVPAAADIPSLIYQLQSAADGARVDFRGLQTSASPASSGGPTTTTQASSLPPNVSVGSNGFPTQTFTFTFTGTYFQLSKFIDHVQHFVSVKGDKVTVRGRLLALTSISLAAASTGFPKVTATISANAYLMPASQTPATGTTPTAPSTTTSTPTASAPGGSHAPASPAVVTPIR